MRDPPGTEPTVLRSGPSHFLADELPAEPLAAGEHRSGQHRIRG